MTIRHISAILAIAAIGVVGYLSFFNAPKAPQVMFKTIAGESIATSDLKGKVVGFVDNTKPNFDHLIEDLAEVQPVYRTLPGWKKDITGIRKLTDLPKEARAYVDAVAELIGTPVSIVSVGPDREQTMMS